MTPFGPTIEQWCDLADLLAARLEEEARESHDFRLSHQATHRTSGNHTGCFHDCTTLRCDMSRKALAAYRAMRPEP